MKGGALVPIVCPFLLEPPLVENKGTYPCMYRWITNIISGVFFAQPRLVCYLIAAYEYSYQEDQDKALNQLTDCEQLFQDEKERNIETYNQLKEAVSYVTQSTRVYLLYRTGKVTQAKQVKLN